MGKTTRSVSEKVRNLHGQQDEAIRFDLGPIVQNDAEQGGDTFEFFSMQDRL